MCPEKLQGNCSHCFSYSANSQFLSNTKFLNMYSTNYSAFKHGYRKFWNTLILMAKINCFFFSLVYQNGLLSTHISVLNLPKSIVSLLNVMKKLNLHLNHSPNQYHVSLTRKQPTNKCFIYSIS